jgi:ankyrin repeat protein
MGFTIASKFRKAISNDDAEALKALLEKYPQVDINTLSVNMDGHTPLNFAIRYGHEKAALALLALGADPNKMLGYGRTPMHQAASYGRIHLVAEMLKRGGNPNLRDADEQTVQALAAYSKRHDIVKLLEPYMIDPLSLLQDSLPKPAEKPSEEKTIGDRWDLLAEDTIAHVFATGETGYRITEIFNFSAAERLRIVQNIASNNDHIETKSFDDLGAEGLQKAFVALKARGGQADESVLKRSGAQLDKPRVPTQKNG